MDGNVNVTGNKRSLNFCREQSFSACAQIEHSGFVALRRDDFCLNLCLCPHRLDCFFHQTSLRARQFAAACPQDYAKVLHTQCVLHR
jgi:hypothetical protein